MFRINLFDISSEGKIDQHFIDRFNSCLDDALLSKSNLIIIEGQKGIFNHGMDLQKNPQQNFDTFSRLFFDLLSRLYQSPKVVISLVDGQVVAGGMGIIAASDIVIASQQSQFSLSEALWGLIPCTIAPFIINRIGKHQTRTLTLSTLPISSEKAYHLGLVDYVELNTSTHSYLKSLVKRIEKINPITLSQIKPFFDVLDGHQDKETAATTLQQLGTSPLVRTNLHRFASEGYYPWEKDPKNGG